MGYAPIPVAGKTCGCAETELALRDLIAVVRQLRDLIAV